MPDHFQLINKRTGEAETLKEIDRKLCNHFGKEHNDAYYVCNWYHSIVWAISFVGLELGSDELRERFEKPGYTDELRECLRYIEEHYTLED